MQGFLKSGAICSWDEKTVIIGYGKQRWSRTQDAYPVWFAPDFFLKEKPFLHFEHTKIGSPKEIFQGKKALDVKMKSLDMSVFERAFYRFKNSSLKKAVPYVIQEGEIDQPFTGSFLQNCLEYHLANPNTALYGFWNEEEGMMGVTPELIASVDKGTLKSMACAGTAYAADASIMDKDLKLLTEHRIVIDGIFESLKKFGDVRIGQTKPAIFSKIAHLVTPIEIKNSRGCIQEIVQSLHPTFAIGAFPKNEGQKFLNWHDELLPRGRYGAPFGVLKNPETAKIYLAIRMGAWKKNKVQLAAGCGILPESSLDAEKKEIYSKLQAICEILGID